MNRAESYCVYIQQPESHGVLTCGRFVRERNAIGDVIARFVNGRRYREHPSAVPIDPLHLALSNNTYETTQLDGVLGAIRDASPDAWGRRVIEHALGNVDVSEVEYLLNLPEDRAGALKVLV